MIKADVTTRRRHSRGNTPGARSVPALYGTLTTGLVTAVIVVASVVAPASPPSIAELGPSAQDRIEEARADQGIGSGEGVGGTCAPDDVECMEAEANDPAAGGTGSDSGIPPALQVAAGRRCFGDPPRQTEDPHSPPCVFEIFKGDNGGATAPGVTATEVRFAVHVFSEDDPSIAMVQALVAHFNLRYEFYGRRLSPAFVPLFGLGLFDPAANRAFAEDVIATKPFGAMTAWLPYATNAVIYRRLAQAGVVSAVSQAPAFDSDAVTDGLTWLVEPPLDIRLQAGARLVCGALNGRPASHAGPDVQAATTSRRFAVVVLTEPGGRPDPGPLESGLRGCNADFETFDVPFHRGEAEYENLMVQLKSESFTTVLTVSSFLQPGLYQAASSVGYFPEWMDLGANMAHWESSWEGSGRTGTGGHGDHAFGFTSEVRVRPDGEAPAMWAVREGGGNGIARFVSLFYDPLLLLASGIQGAGPNLTPETFAAALYNMEFPNPNPGTPPYWQQRVGFGPGDPAFHDDYAIWWWNETAPSQTSNSASGRGSFCYLDRGGRFTVDAFPTNADGRLFSASEPCR